MAEISKTPEELKKGLECCRPIWKSDHFKTCDSACPYVNEGHFCRTMLYSDALALIRQHEAERERDGENIKKLCSYLAYGIPDAHVEEKSCNECERKCECRDCPDGTCFIICKNEAECKAGDKK